MRSSRLLRLLAATFAVALATGPAEAAARRWPHDILREDFGYTEKSSSDVPLSELTQGCPRRDCIPSIDAPRFTAPGEKPELHDEDLVLGLVRGGTARAYPVWVLDRHEIVNDVIAGEPVAVTWCPLCGSGIAFRRVLDGTPVELGVSGLLRESDLVFYDRRTRSLWQQVTGTAFVGPSRGKRLESISVAVTTWARWRAAHPGTTVLVTGDARPSRNAYGDYATSQKILFPVTRTSRALPGKEVVWGIELEKGSVAVTDRRLGDGGSVAVDAGGVRLEVSRLADGTVRAVRASDGREVVAHRMFWFAWYTFHPDTRVVDLEKKTLAPTAD
mgnify:FL=1